jgi:recombination protein RecA
VDDLKLLRRSLAKSFGEDSVVFASDIPHYDLVSSGSLALDYAVGGGIPHNRVIEIAGAEGGGKTSLALLMIKKFLDKYPDKGAVILDLEHRLTSTWITQLIGPEATDRIIVLWPDHAEASTDMYTEIAKSGAVSVILYDSVGGAPTQRVTDKSATIGNVGGNALAITRLAQFASIYSDKYKVCSIFINQQREDMSGYNQFITPGGRGLKHACSLRIKLSKGKEKITEKVNNEEIQVGYSVRCQVIKNSLAAPYKECYYLFYNVPTEKFGFGVDWLEELVRLGSLSGAIEQRGRGWFYHPHLPLDSAGEHKVHGLPALMKVIREQSAVRDTIVADIKSKLHQGAMDAPATSFDPDQLDEIHQEPGFFTGFDEGSE